MNIMTDAKNLTTSNKTAGGKVRMTPSEAFIETLVAHKVKDVFGIVGSAYMDSLDLFPAAGIRFIPTVHEQGSAHMADGFFRATGRHGVIARARPAPATPRAAAARSTSTTWRIIALVVAIAIAAAVGWWSAG